MESSAGILLFRPILIEVHDVLAGVVSLAGLVGSVGISSSVATSIGVGVAAELRWPVISVLGSAGRGSGVGILFHMMRWSRPEILNAVRELSRHVKEATTKHQKQLIRVMKYCVGTPLRGLTLEPKRSWNGKK